MNNYKAALEDMVWQFAYRGVKNGKSVLYTAGLSALELAFEALGWSDPKYFEDMDGAICDVEGCAGWVTSGGINWRETGYWCLCHEHGFSKEPQPKMKQRAMDKEARKKEVRKLEG